MVLRKGASLRGGFGLAWLDAIGPGLLACQGTGTLDQVCIQACLLVLPFKDVGDEVIPLVKCSTLD